MMRRILVPLDGSELSNAIIPDARRVAGPDGELILVRDITSWWYDPDAHDALVRLAESLRAEGIRVEAQTLVTANTALAIDEAAEIFHADMIACATHGRGPLERLVRGGVAWRAVAHSPVPVLLRHPEDEPVVPQSGLPRRIMVPLDGSEYAKLALPLAVELAQEWGASLWITSVVSELSASENPYHRYLMTPNDIAVQVEASQAYLAGIAKNLPGEVMYRTLGGDVIKALAGAIDDWGITDVVLASHGRTGLSRVILGSVADGLIHRVHCPVLVIPALAAKKLEPISSMRQEAAKKELAGSAKP